MEGTEKIIVYAVAAACILGIIVVGTLVLTSHTSNEGFSELYFENPDNLPSIIDVGEKINSSFLLVSHEKTPTSYAFNVTFDGALVKTGSFNLAPEEKQNVEFTIVPRRSSLVLFNTSRVAQYRTELDSQSSSFQLNGSESSIPAFVTPVYDNLRIRAWNSSEVQSVGSPDYIEPSKNPSGISSLGYILRLEHYSVEDEKGKIYLNHALSATEHRYKFQNVSVSVSSLGMPTVGVQNSDVNNESKRGYEIHFLVIVRENPRNLVNLLNEVRVSYSGAQ